VIPEIAVSKLAAIVAEKREFSEDEIYSAMSSESIPSAVADRAFKFTQIAWGRALLDGIGVQFSPEYFCFNASGEVTESGRLEEEPYYFAALALVPQNIKSAGFQRLALMSADVHAVNQLLNKGSDPKNIITTPAYLFLEAPTEVGIKKAEQVIAEYMASLKKVRPVQKPWWRFWQHSA